MTNNYGFKNIEIDTIYSKTASLAEKRSAIEAAATRNAETVDSELVWLADDSGEASEKVTYTSDIAVAKTVASVVSGDIRFDVIEIVETLLENEENAVIAQWSRVAVPQTKPLSADEINDVYSDNAAKRYSMLNQ